MATNDFKTFAATSGANVITQANYSALTAQQTGFQSGIAQSAQLNKVWRQSSIISSMIAQFICDRTGQNATDDGTIATLEDNFIAAIQSVNRIRLTGPINLFVSPAGSDAITLGRGLTASLPFLTIQAAYNYLTNSYDLAGQAATINLANGTYSAGASFGGKLTGQGAGSVTILGNAASPASVVINSSTQVVNTFQSILGAQVFINGMTINSSGTGEGGVCLVAQTGAQLIYTNIIFGTAVVAHITANVGGVIIASGANTITGSAPQHIIVGNSGVVILDGSGVPITYTINNSPTFSSAFIVALSGYVVSSFTTFTGAVIGRRFSAAFGGFIDVSTSSPTYFPGTIAGTVNPGPSQGFYPGVTT